MISSLSSWVTAKRIADLDARSLLKCGATRPTSSSNSRRLVMLMLRRNQHSRFNLGRQNEEERWMLFHNATQRN